MGESPLWIALDQNVEVMQVFISARANANFKHTHHGSLLRWACCLGNSKAVLLLLDRGTHYMHLSGSVYAAAGCGYKDILEIFHEHDSTMVQQTNKQGYTLLHVAVNTEQMNCIEFLLDKGADIFACTCSCSKQKTFECAVHKGWLDGIFLMMKCDPVKILSLLHRTEVAYHDSPYHHKLLFL